MSSDAENELLETRGQDARPFGYAVPHNARNAGLASTPDSPRFSRWHATVHLHVA